MIELTIIFVPIVASFLLFVPGLYIPKFVLGCVFEAERKRGLPTQFQMSDLLWLTFLVQIGLVAVRSQFATAESQFAHDRSSQLALYGFVLLSVPLIWWHCLRVLSRAGVLEFGKRGLFLVVVVPLTLILTVVGACAGAAVPMLIFESFDSGSLTRVFVALLLFVVTIVTSFLLRKAAAYCIAEPVAQNVAQLPS